MQEHKYKCTLPHCHIEGISNWQFGNFTNLFQFTAFVMAC